MRLSHWSGVVFAAIVCFCGSGRAQVPLDRASLLPIPQGYPNTSAPAADYYASATPSRGYEVPPQQPLPQYQAPPAAQSYRPVNHTPNRPVLWSNYNPSSDSTLPSPSSSMTYDVVKGGKYACDSCGPVCGCAGWYGRAGGSYMTRDRANPVWFSFDTANVGSALLGTPSADVTWGWGADALVGHTICNGCFGLEVGYWGIYPGSASLDVFDPDGTTGNASDLNSSLDFAPLEYNLTAANDLFDNAEVHRLTRSYEVHNVEVNLVGSPYGPLFACGPRVQWRWLAGFRYLKFNDGFQFWTDDADTVFTGAVDELQYNVNVDNYFYGGQLGGSLRFNLTRRFSGYAGMKAGVFAARYSHDSIIAGSGGVATVNDPSSPFDGQAFNIASHKNDVALFGELDFGGRYQITPHWAATFGYRAMGISGVAISSNQIPQNFGDLRAVDEIDSNGSLILHGGYGGLEFLY